MTAPEIQILAREIAAHIKPTIGWFDYDGAALYLTMSTDSLKQMVKRGQMPYTKAPNGRIRFRREDLDAWITSGYEGPMSA
jgi:excisionase family DNA binding protein